MKNPMDGSRDVLWARTDGTTEQTQWALHGEGDLPVSLGTLADLQLHDVNNKFHESVFTGTVIRQ
jgi:hypothetical protein